MVTNLLVGGVYIYLPDQSRIRIEEIGGAGGDIYFRDVETGVLETWETRDILKFCSLLCPSVGVEKLHDAAIIPTYQTPGAAGFDLHITADVTIPANRVLHPYTSSQPGQELAFDNYVIVGTGLAFEIPPGYELEIRGRSGLAFKHRVTSFNGTVDSDYRGEVKLLITNDGPLPVELHAGDRVAQGIIRQVEQVQFTLLGELSTTERGTGGFGSTGQ